MRVALLSPISWRTPPRRYGPWEQVVSNLAEGLVANGVDVTLFATGDSLTSGRLAWCIEKPCSETPGVDTKVSECLHISQLMERADEYDLIHNHFDFLPLTYSRLIHTPLLTTIHGFSSPLIVPVYKKYNKDGYYVSISHADRHPELSYCGTVYNGIDASAFTFREEPGSYLLFFGRIHPDKGTADAIHIARKAGKKLVIAGLVQDERYFENEVKPFVDGREVLYAGNCGPQERDALLGNALALLHPIHFEEPFGLSVAESFFCGTPVIAYKRGSMPELISDGKTGFMVAGEEEAAGAVERIGGLKRQRCRDVAVEKFSVERMTADYLQLYRSITGLKPEG
jgi:glycosyltransferase involved in cell wall biosynthesis